MLNSFGHMDIIGAFLTPAQAHQFHVASKHLLEMINAQNFFWKGILGLGLFAAVGIFFTYVKLFLARVPKPRSLEYAQIRILQHERKRLALRRRRR